MEKQISRIFLHFSRIKFHQFFNFSSAEMAEQMVVALDVLIVVVINANTTGCNELKYVSHLTQL